MQKTILRLGGVLLAVGTVAAVTASAAAATATAPDLGSRIDAFVQDERESQRIPGVAIAVVHKGQVIRANGYGLADVEHNVPVRPETIFQSGSVGKMFTAAAVMTLVEDGKLGLDDPVTKYLRGAPPAWRGMKVRHLLTHTSGLPSDLEPLELQRDYTEDQLVALGFKQKLRWRPGERWGYSNAAYVLLGVIVHKASGKFYGDVLHERVFGPLGMDTARVISEHDLIPNRSSGYAWAKDELKIQEWVSPTLNTTADGSLYFSILDLVAWDRGLREGRVLKPESWAQVFTPVTLTSGKTYPYGFGWFLRDVAGQQLVHHGGAWQGFRTNVARYLGEDLTVIALTNAGQASPARFTDGIARLVNPALAPEEAPIPDDDPQVTARVKLLLADAQKGQLKARDFTGVTPDFLKAINTAYAAGLKDKGALQRLDLVKREALGDDVDYRYRGAFADAAVFVNATLAPNGRFASLSLRLAPQVTLIRNAQVIDGTGASPTRADVRIRDGRIVALGALEPHFDDTVVDARGLTLAPGFIDTHSHHDRGIDEQRDALAAVSQGITTIIAGQDGSSAVPLSRQFIRHETRPVAVNLASYVGHNSVREKVMGGDFKRTAAPAELARMRELVDEGMRDGAIGLSTGLEYDPGIYSSKDEVLELAKVAARHGGRYISHMRSEDRQFWEALDELIEIGKATGMPVQVSHIKLAMRALWGKGDELVKRLEKARRKGVQVSADIYPYTMWQSTLTVLYPQRNFSDRAETDFILKNIAAPQDLVLGRYDAEPSYVGKSVAQIALATQTDAADTLMALIARSQAAKAEEMVVATSMDEGDIGQILRWPHTNICSDGMLNDAHPRGRGSYPRVLAHYVRDKGVLSLPEAIRKMSGLAATNMGLRERGTIAVGNWADLVLFDPATVADHATVQDPKALSTGIDTVWVNGQVVFAKGKTTSRYPGRVLRPPRP